MLLCSSGVKMTLKARKAPMETTGQILIGLKIFGLFFGIFMIDDHGRSLNEVKVYFRISEVT